MAVLRGERPLKPPDINIPEWLWSLINHCWRAEPVSRPRADDLFQSLSSGRNIPPAENWSDTLFSGVQKNISTGHQDQNVLEFLEAVVKTQDIPELAQGTPANVEDSQSGNSPSHIRDLGQEPVIAIGKTAVDISVEFAPVPELQPAVDLLFQIIELCENVSINRTQARSLSLCCYNLLQAVRDHEHHVPNSLQTISQDVQACFKQIRVTMAKWAELGFIKSFLNQDYMMEDIESCLVTISDCFRNFQFAGTMEISHWQEDFEKAYKEDQKGMLMHLSDIKNGQAMALEISNEPEEKRVRFMTRMQDELGQHNTRGDTVHSGLSSNLYQIQLECKEILPDLHLKRGEVERIGVSPLKGEGAMDIYEGLYLKRERVAIKTIRASNFNPKNIERFSREVEVWTELWKVDRGKHILPFYGFCVEGGPYPYPYMVSPWKSNGTAIDYVTKFDLTVNYPELMINIARGIQVLHYMKPPVVHGGLKADNIVIDETGNPLIASFGSSQIIKDITRVPFSLSRMTNSWRWSAPEVIIDGAPPSLAVDIYAFAMTVLEIYTHKRTFSNIEDPREVLIELSNGIFPLRPTEAQVLQRGLDDNTWNLMTKCWSSDASSRPNIDAVLSTLGASEAL
ncbi:hypothetical protein VNI00_018087 [Paramarasmius palmivorus]|uniref:Protein kinase domain-containing protein n=1 Tax=Paramarasmius palmivorus TaxID=297713 RepID=A0AAW0B0C4_9AGAR